MSRLIRQYIRPMHTADTVERLRLRSIEAENQLTQVTNLLTDIQKQVDHIDSVLVPDASSNGLRFYGQFDPPVDRFIFTRYFPDKNISGVCVESGAFDGLIESSCNFFEKEMGWQSYNIEPMPDAFQRLTTNRPKSHNYNFAFSNQCGTAIFRQVLHPDLGLHFGNSSLSHTDLHLSDLKERGCSFTEIEVSTLTWRTWIEQENIHFVDLLVLDVEGHELQVIEGMVGSEVLPDVICCEIGHLNFNKVRKAFHELGYAYDVTSHVNAFFVKQDRLSLFALRANQRTQ